MTTLKDLIQKQAIDSFNDTSGDETEVKEIELNALGIMVASYCDWGGIDIMKVFMYALEDANCHGYEAIVDGWIKTAKGE